MLQNPMNRLLNKYDYEIYTRYAKNREKSFDAGSNGFICKPFRIKELLSQFHTHLSMDWIYSDDEVLPLKMKSHK